MAISRVLLAIAILNLVFLFTELAFNVIGVALF